MKEHFINRFSKQNLKTFWNTRKKGDPLGPSLKSRYGLALWNHWPLVKSYQSLKNHDIKFRLGNDPYGKSEPSGVQVAHSYPRRGTMRVSTELLPWVFVLLRHSEIKLHWLDSPELTLQDDTILICYYVKWGRLTRHLGFNYILKSKQITETNAKSNQNAYEMYKVANCCNEMKKTEKKTEKPVHFWRNLYEI